MGARRAHASWGHIWVSEIVPSALSVASDFTGADHTFMTWVGYANGDYIVAVDCRADSSWVPCTLAPLGTTFVRGVWHVPR